MASAPGGYQADCRSKWAPELALVAIAATIVADMGVGERVSTLAGDYFKDAFPTGNDVVMISGVFHRESEATCRWLIQRAADSLVSGGLLLISDVFTDASGNQPAFATAETRPLPPPMPMPHRLIVGQKA